MYPDDLPTASIVFVFYNEAISTLYRSIHSVLNRTPAHLLHEIVLVDDASDAPLIKQPLDDYIKLLPKVKIVRLGKRSGLMTARTEGAKAATGEVVVFLDSHIECTQGWIQPLLARIKEDRKHVVMPIIDSIDADSFEYGGTGIDILSVSWSMEQTALSRVRGNSTGPWPSVIMAGGLFAIDRKLFFEIGGYDPEMKIWGGEEMEISFRIWQCGMTLECLPCSHVGHIFRSAAYWQGHPYGIPGGVIKRNKLRVAEVWMNEYKDIVFEAMGSNGKEDLGPLDYMRDLRKRLQCKPFKWFLDNIFPELFVPNDESQIQFKGDIRNEKTGQCVDTLGHAKHNKIGVYGCHKQKGHQFFLFTTRGEIRVAQSGYTLCLDRSGDNSVSLWECHGGGGNQKWIWNKDTKHLSDENEGACLEVIKESDKFQLKVFTCVDKPEMQWEFRNLTSKA